MSFSCLFCQYLLIYPSFEALLPLGWIFWTLSPPCSSLKDQSRKTPALIGGDGSACHPKHHMEARDVLLGTMRRAVPAAERRDRTDEPIKTSPLTFVSIIPLVSQSGSVTGSSDVRLGMSSRPNQIKKKICFISKDLFLQDRKKDVD